MLLLVDLWGTIMKSKSTNKKIAEIMNVEYNEDTRRIFLFCFMLRKESLKKSFYKAATILNTPKEKYFEVRNLLNNLVNLGPIENTFEILEKLRDYYCLALLSNTIYYSFKKAAEKYKISKYFDKIYISPETGLLKPNPETFLYPIYDLGYTPRETILIDDSKRNKIASEKLGIKHYFSIKEFYNATFNKKFFR